MAGKTISKTIAKTPKVTTPSATRPERKRAARQAKAPSVTSRKTDGHDEKGRFAQGNKVGVPFHPGYDPRRNYEGRPNSHDELREMIKNIGAQEVEVTNTAGQTFKAPIVYLMLRDMFTGRDSRDHQNILEHGWGKVKDQLEIDDTGITDDQRAERIAALLDAARARRDGQTDGTNQSSNDPETPP